MGATRSKTSSDSKRQNVYAVSHWMPQRLQTVIKKKKKKKRKKKGMPVTEILNTCIR